MIAHRLSTIVTAQNLLYLEDNNSVLSAEKGTPEYDRLIDRLTQINYRHQDENQLPIKSANEKTESEDKGD